MATYVYASSQGQRTHSARTKIVATYVYASSQGQRTHFAQTKIVAYLSCSAGRTHFAQTNVDQRSVYFPKLTVVPVLFCSGR